MTLDELKRNVQIDPVLLRMACDDPIQVVTVKNQPGRNVYHVLKDNNVIAIFESLGYATDFINYQSTISDEIYFE